MVVGRDVLNANHGFYKRRPLRYVDKFLTFSNYFFDSFSSYSDRSVLCILNILNCVNINPRNNTS